MWFQAHISSTPLKFANVPINEIAEKNPHSNIGCEYCVSYDQQENTSTKGGVPNFVNVTQNIFHDSL
jgi:hypothetical protein